MNTPTGYWSTGHHSQSSHPHCPYSTPLLPCIQVYRPHNSLLESDLHGRERLIKKRLIKMILIKKKLIKKRLIKKRLINKRLINKQSLPTFLASLVVNT